VLTDSNFFEQLKPEKYSIEILKDENFTDFSAQKLVFFAVSC